MIQEVSEKRDTDRKFYLNTKKSTYNKILTKEEVLSHSVLKAYIGNSKDFLELSLLNKKYYKLYRLEFAKKMLLNNNITDEHRRKLWPMFISDEFKNVKLVNDLQLKDQSTAEIIRLDVRRTFNGDLDFCQDVSFFRTNSRVWR